ncbi:glycine-rich domain-containing protein [Pseudomonas guariconensis]|uniref:glycine-rich domain-containing protein n=1 Tax=Pseudomonas guariconensis TaxID=1288410 RepID=UPI0038723219
MNRASIMALLDTVLLRSWRIGADPIVASTALTADQLGHVVVDATAGAVAVTLPSASAALGGVEVTLRRKDVTTNVLSIVAAGADKIVLPGDANGIAATELLFPGDYLTLRADGAGKWWCVGQAQLPASLASGLVVFAATGVSTFTVPPVLRSGRRRPIVTVIGGGGGGARSGASPGPSGGGGGGVAESIVDLTGIATVSVTVGLGGAGGAASGDNGAAGGTSSFGAFMSATGGVGGFANTAASGASGVGTGGAVNYGLGHGGLPLLSAVSTIYGGSGGGASSVHSNSGGAPTSPGHGGGGRTTVPGHAGLSGQVEVRW